MFTPSKLLHAGLESAEVVDLGSEHQVGQLSVRQEDDEEHDGKAHQVLGAAGHGAGELTHGLVQVDELKKLQGRERLEIWKFGGDHKEEEGQKKEGMIP